MCHLIRNATSVVEHELLAGQHSPAQIDEGGATKIKRAGDVR
jgi:hypothetical protein